MNNVFRVMLFSLVLFCSVVAASQPTVVVQLQLDTEQSYFYTYTEPPRLSQVLENVTDPARVYWPAAALYRQSAEHEQLRQQLLRRLQLLEQHWQVRNQSQYVLVLQSLRHQVQAWQLAERQPNVIDFDKARYTTAANPRLDPGHYQLIVKPRSNQVTFVGALAEERVVEFKGGRSVHDYLSALPALRHADPSWLHVIQASGQLQQVGRAYWNRQFVEVLPGSMVLLPLHPAILPKEFRNLNQELIQLAAHRILP